MRSSDEADGVSESRPVALDRPIALMNDQGDLTFAIPTYRLRDVGETVEQYDEHFWRNGHSPQIIVFNDSTPVNQEKYFPQRFAPARATLTPWTFWRCSWRMRTRPASTR
jgi:hypothetical protein